MTDRDRNPSDPASGDDAASKPTEDEVWQDLVSRLQASEDGERREGENEGESGSGQADTTTPSGGRAEERSPAPSPDPRSTPAPIHGRPSGRPLGPRDHIAPEEPEGFVPDEPAPLSGAQPLSVLAWVGAVGAPLAMLLSALLWQSAPWTAVFGMIVVFIASVAYLLLRLPSERNNDDDGAVL